jgi:3-hydroxybutyryl-CoA dehydrogenase
VALRELRVVVVGAGLMGVEIGCEYALGGHAVTLVARDAERARERAREKLDFLRRERLASAEACTAAAHRLSVSDDVAAASAGVDIAVESLPEVLELKAELLRVVLGAAPDAVVASNTSSIPITALGDALDAPAQTIGVHYLNPPLLMPTVELIAGERTDPAVVERMHGLLVELGKRPIRVRRDVPGFIWNRLQFALLRECAQLVDDGVASTADVDLVLREGLARRWRVVGPFAALALGGVETWTRAAANLLPALSTASELGDLSRFLAPQPEELERLRNRRDRALADQLRRERSRPEG